jgi:hypothetical protein
LHIYLFKKISIGAGAVIAIAITVMVISLQSSVFQTWIAGKTIKAFTKELNGKVSVGEVYYLFFNNLIIRDLLVTTTQGDTLLYCEKLSASFSARNLVRNRFRFRSVHLSNGEFNLVSYQDTTSNISRFFGHGRNKEKGSKSEGISAHINIRNILLDNFRFTYKNLRKKTELPDGGIKFSDLELNKIRVEASGLRTEKGKLRATLKNLSFIEKSGFELKKMNARLEYGNKGILVEDLYLYDKTSEVKASSLSFNYSSPAAFQNFTDSVSMAADLDNTFLCFRSIGSFAPSLKNNNLAFYASGLITGPLSNLRTERLDITSETGITTVSMKARFSGLPDIRETMAFVDIGFLTTTSSDIAKILTSINPQNKESFIYRLSPLVRYDFSGRLAGLLTDFVANGNLTSNIGNIYMDVLLRKGVEEKSLELQGKLKTDNFNIGVLTGSKVLGEVTLNSTMSALLRDKKYGGSNFYIDSVSVKKLEFNNYPYRNIYSVGSYVKNRFDGRIICHDPNLDFIFQGIFGHSSKEDSYYDFYADVVYADLAAINLDTRDSISVVSFKTLANFTRKLKGDIFGNISIKSIDYKNRNGNFAVGDISIQSASSQNNFDISLKSTFADASYTGSDSFTTFFDKIRRITIEKHLPSLLVPGKNGRYGNRAQWYKLNVNFYDTKAIAQMLLPGLIIAEKSYLSAEVDSTDKFLFKFNSSTAGFGKNIAHNLDVNAISGDKEITARINSGFLNVSGIENESADFTLSADADIIRLRGMLKNGTEFHNIINLSSDIRVSLSVPDSIKRFDITINPSELHVNNQEWTMSRSQLSIQDSIYTIDGFNLRSGEQLFSAQGVISPDRNDSLTVAINRFDISPLNLFLKLPFPIEGNLSGRATVKEIYQDFKLLMDMKGRDMTLSGKRLGTLDILSEWDSERKNFNIALKNRLDDADPFYVKGIYRPQDKFLDIKGVFENMQVSYFEPVFSGIVSNMNGTLSGELHLYGPVNKLLLTSDNTTVNDMGFTVDFTNVPYKLNGPVLLTEKGLNVNNATITDRFGNRGRVNGGLLYKNFRDISLNTNIFVRNMECLNTGLTDNSAFYGKAFGTGNVSITGPFKKVMLDISVTTNKNTEVHIPLSSTSEATNSDLLRFVSFAGEDGKTDGLSEPGISGEKSRGSDLIVKFKGNVTPDAALLIEIDKSVGDVITGYGTGIINIDVQPSKDLFNIQGDYIIERGSYKFVLQGLFNRDFTIQQGGNIGFNGDILKTNLNLTANYRTKAAINTLISDTSSVSSRRNVDCLIKMSGALMNPKLSFDIQIPDIDPLTKSRVDAALNTEDKIVKQVMSLLVSGSFIPDIQSSIVNNSTILYSNATEVLSNQINNIFKQLDIPLDLSFNYLPGQNGRDLFDAAVSAQLFDNRVIVNGNIGNSKYLNKNGSVVGDLDVEIKLDEQGRFRAKAFSHSADQFSNYLDNSQRNGIGLVYQEEFSSFRELINSLFMSKKRAEQRAAERENRLKGLMEKNPESVTK